MLIYYFQTTIYTIKNFAQSVEIERSFMSTSDILHSKKQIEKKKKQLQQLVKLYGYKHPIVLACSQELDQLVYLIIREESS